MSAAQLFENAVKTYNIWYKLFDKDYYTMQAYDLFVKAKNKYIVSKNNDRITSCYEWMIKCRCEVINNFYCDDLGTIYDDYAFFLFNNHEIDKAMVFFDKAIDIYYDHGYFPKIIKIKELLADYYRKQNESKTAIKLYNELKDLYSLQNQTRYCTNYRINKILFELYIKTDNFLGASQIYDISNLNDEMINKFKYDELITSTVLCFICIDTILAKRRLADFTNKFPSFTSKEQYSFLVNVIECVENNDIEPLNSINKQKLDPVDQLLIDKIKGDIKDFSYV